MKPQTEEQWLMVLAVIERLYAEVRAGNWDGLRQMLHGYATSPPEPSEQLVEAMAELIYLRKYGKDGARWELNESKDVWRTQARAALGSVSSEPRDEPLPPCSTCGGETVPFCTSCGYTTTKPAEYPAYTECQHDHMKPNPTLRATYPKHGSQSGWVQEYRCNVCQCSFERPIATAGLRANGETP